MSDSLGDEEASFSEWLASCRGARKLLADEYRDNDDLIEWAGDVWSLLEYLGDSSKQHAEAVKLLYLLQPTQVDADLWEELALKGEASLLGTHQFGRRSLRDTKHSRPRVLSGAVEKEDPPTQFARRQGKAVVAAEAEVARLKEELAAAETRRAELQNGLQIFASVGLLMQMRKTTAPMFAMGPAWTVLRAIQGSTGKEVSDDSRTKETKRILAVLHALRGHLTFEQEVKHALLDVCHRWMTEASRRGKPGAEFDGPEDYELILKNLGWPSPSADSGDEDSF